MKLLGLLFLLTTAAYAQTLTVTHPIDFDEAFFKRSPYSCWMRDPFKNPPGFSKGGAATESWPKLTSIVNARIPYAILDGNKFKEGQFLNQNRFVSVIGQNYVILSEGNFDYEIVLDDRGLASSPEVKQ